MLLGRLSRSASRRCVRQSSYPPARTDQQPIWGCPRAGRMVSLLAWRTTRPVSQMTPKRTAFRRLLTHSLANTRCFTAEFRLNANTTIAHHAALAPIVPTAATACEVFLQHRMYFLSLTAPVILYHPPSPICIVGTDSSTIPSRVGFLRGSLIVMKR